MQSTRVPDPTHKLIAIGACPIIAANTHYVWRVVADLARRGAFAIAQTPPARAFGESIPRQPSVNRVENVPQNALIATRLSSKAGAAPAPPPMAVGGHEEFERRRQGRATALSPFRAGNGEAALW